MSRRHRDRALIGLAGILAAMLALAASGLQASTPVVWEHPARAAGPAPDNGAARAGRTQAVRPGGKADGVARGEAGRLTLSVPLREMFPGASPAAAPTLIWGAVLDETGQVHMGTGNSAEVITLDRKGATAEGVEMNELGVRALATLPGGELFFGTFPNGDIYRMPRGKDPELWAEMDERYIWSMLADTQQRLLVGTGERGLVYRVTSRGQKEVVFDSDQ
jgi:hypothetical protein